jgi:hypothetical protein
VKSVAVYSKKDYENYINRDKIKKQKIKKRIYRTIIIVAIIALFSGLIALFFQDKTNFVKTDNYTDAINYAIDKFVNIKPTSHDDYPRLTYDFYSLPPITPNDSVEDENVIHKEYNNNNQEIPDIDNGDSETSDNKQTNIDNKNKDEKNEENASNDKQNPDYIVDNEDEEEPPFYEYDYFIERMLGAPHENDEW